MHMRRRAPHGSGGILGAALMTSVLLLLPSSGATAQKASGANGPRIVLPETRKDAGAIPRGEVLRVSFPVRNEGTSDLAISDVRVSCGCTVSRFDPVIRPGSEGKIELAIETRTFSGPISKTAIVVSSDPSTPQVTLTVNAVVKPFVEVSSPGFLRLQTLAGVPAAASVLLYSDDPAFKPAKAEPPVEGGLKVTLEPAPEKERIPGKNANQWKLTLFSEGSSIEGILGGAVKVATGIARQPELEIPVTGFIRPTLSVSASYLNFGNFEFKGQVVARDVNLTNNDPKNTSFAVSRVEVSGAEAKAEIVKLDSNRFRVTLTMNPKQKKGEFEGNLRIYTNDPAKPEIKIPFQGLVF